MSDKATAEQIEAMRRHNEETAERHRQEDIKSGIDRSVRVMPSVGEYRKVLLPGETPWAECMAVEPDGTWQGRIANKLFTEYTDAEREEIAGFGPQIEALPRLHGFKQDQIVRFVWLERNGYWSWVPAESPGGAA